MQVVSCPDPLGMKPFDQLSDQGLNASSFLDQPTRPRTPLPTGRFIGSQEVGTLLAQMFGEPRTPIIAVGQDPPFDTGQEIRGGHLDIVKDRRGKAQSHNNPSSADPHVGP